jgi:hypothetical protein
MRRGRKDQQDRRAMSETMRQRWTGVIWLVVMAAWMVGCASAPKETPTASDSGGETHKEAPASPDGITYEGGDGSSIEKAVIIKGAPNTFKGVGAEADWIRKNHPGWRKGMQALTHVGKKYYDRIDYTTPGGETRTIYFDITDFFGKW